MAKRFALLWFVIGCSAWCPLALAGFIRKPCTRKVLLHEIIRLGVVDVSAIEQEPLGWI